MPRRGQRRFEPEGKKHPEGGMELLIHFHESVLQYDLYTQEVLKVDDGITDADGDPNFIKYCLRASLLRKYWAREDELALDKVIPVMKEHLDESCASGHQRLELLEHLSESFTCAYRDKNRRETASDTGNMSSAADETSETEYVSVTPHEVAVDYVYGMLIHGDYQKWVNARNSGFLNLLSISNEVFRLEKFVHSTHDILDGMVADGTLTPDFSRIVLDSPTKRSMKFQML